jgi:quercetin dioxygenase-like cupin family protein
MPFLNTMELEVREPLPGWKGRFFSSENMTFGYYDVGAGATIHEHSHDNEEVWHILDGELEVSIGGEKRIAGSGHVAMVPPGTLHSVTVLSSARVIVVDYPVRASIGGVSTE